MKKITKGFTLLEVSVCFVLFAILLELLWGFFGNIYTEFLQFDKKITLNNEAEMIESFFSDYIRGADKVEITVVKKDALGIIQDQKIIEVMLPKEIVGGVDLKNPNNIEISDYELSKIEIEKKQLDATGTIYETKNSEIVFSYTVTSEGERVSRKLEYQALDGIRGTKKGDAKLISNQIENIKVERNIDSNLIEFICTVHREKEINQRLKITFKFSESIAYKERLL